MSEEGKINEELREHVQQLKRELEEERNEVKRIKREKTLEIKAVRDEEQERRRKEIEELKTTTQKKYQDDIKNQMEAIQKKHELDSEAAKAAHVAELAEQLRKLEGEKRETEQKAKQETERKLRAHLDEVHKQEKKNLISESFAAQSKVAELEEAKQNLWSENKSLKKLNQSQSEEHQKSLNNLMKQSKQESQRLMEEIKERERQLQEKEKELASVKRKCAQFEATKDKLEFDLELQKRANTPHVRQTTPTFPVSANDDSEDESSQPMSPRVKELLIKNSELGYLASQQQQMIEKLKKEKAEKEGKMIALEREVEPLKAKHNENMRKIMDFTHSLSSKKKQLEKANLENSELRSERDKIERQLKELRDKHRTRDHKLTELPKMKLELQSKEKEIATLKTEIEQYKELQKKAETEKKRERTVGTRTSPTQPSQPSPSSPSIKLSDVALASQRVQEHKKRQEMEQKLKDMSTKLNEATQAKHKLAQRLEDNNISLKRRDKQIKQLSEENYRLKSANQQLEESRERRQKELESEWKTSHTELERAHAQINKLQQKNTSLHEKVVELERMTPSPNLTSPSPHASPRKTSPSPRTASHPISPPPHPTSPPPHTTSPPPHTTSPPPHTTSPPPHPTSPPATLQSSSHRSTSPLASSPINRTPTPPLLTSSHFPLVLPLEDDFGSQWSLVSNESIMKEQIEQLEYDKNEISIKYDELKKEYGQTKEHYSTLREKYNSLLQKSRDAQEKYKLANTEKLQQEREMSRLQEVCQAEFDVEREKNLREKLKESLRRVADLEEELENQSKEELDEMKEEIEELKEERDQCKDKELQLLQQINEQQEEHEHTNSLLSARIAELSEHKKKVLQLEKVLAEKDGQLEGERAIVTSLQQQLHQLIQKDRLSSVSPHLIPLPPSPQPLISSPQPIVSSSSSPQPLIASPQPIIPSPQPLIPSPSPDIQEYLESAENVTSQIQQIIKTGTPSSSAQSSDYLMQQLQHLLTEAKQLVQEQSVLTKELQLSPLKGASPTKKRDEETDSAQIGQNKNEKFQQWLTQFESEKTSLKSRINELEKRLKDGSHRVMELQSLVGELEDRLSTEQSAHASLLAEKEEQLLVPHPVIPQRYKHEVNQALQSTHKAVERKNVEKIKAEVNKLDQKIKELLQLVYNETESLPNKMTSSPFYKHSTEDDLTSLSPSPIKSALHSSLSSSPAPPFDGSPVKVSSPSHAMPPAAMPHLIPSVSPSWSYTQPQLSLSPTFYSVLNSPSKTPPTNAPLSTKPSLSAINDLLTSAAAYTSSGIQPRLFVALFNYNPKSLCATGHPELELNIQTGDVMLVVSEMDPSGYYTAVFDGRCGLVPSAFIQEMKIDDKEAQTRLLNQSLSSNCSSVIGSEVDITRSKPLSSSQLTHSLPVQMTLLATSTEEDSTLESSLYKPTKITPADIEKPSDSSGHTKIKYVRALYTYIPAKDSPNPEPERELGFTKGDVIKINGDLREDGFYEGELKGKSGFVPSNFVVDIDEIRDPPPHYVLKL